MMPTARVTMKGGSLAFVMTMPLRKPNAMPTAQQARTATKRGSSGDPSGFFIRCRKMSTAPAVAKTGPLDRSMPPAMITKVIPRAIDPTIEVFLNMLRRLPGVRNRGAARPQIPMMTKKTTTTL
jgi:hypothetical protein